MAGCLIRPTPGVSPAWGTRTPASRNIPACEPGALGRAETGLGEAERPGCRLTWAW